MIALCAGCHAKVHRTKVVLTEFPPLLLVLWREQHPEGHEQTYLTGYALDPGSFLRWKTRVPPFMSCACSTENPLTALPFHTADCI